MPLWGARRLFSLLCLLAVLFVPLPAHAEEPDYSIPGRFALPWACEEGHAVTWGPQEHWANGKARGIAFDFAMREGTPLFAPTDGIAYFLRDERPFQTNLGNYVEVVTGSWLVRLAHLRDPQAGERAVRAGELIGYSGSSGASVEHLHLEVLLLSGNGWVRPDLERMVRFFGLALADLTEGALITNEVCPVPLALGSDIHPSQANIRLGDAAELLVPLRNIGLEPLAIVTVQLLLHAPSGASLVAEANGEWLLAGQASGEVAIPVQPNMAGAWKIGRVTFQANEVTYALVVSGTLDVSPSPLKLVGISVRPVLQVGERIALETWVENTGTDDFSLDDLLVMGTRPDGVPWSATLAQTSTIVAGEARQFLLRSTTVPQQVGDWAITQIGYQRDQRVYFFHRLQRSFAVLGPELVIERVAAYTSSTQLSVLLTMTNIGTEPATPDAVEAWGWKPDGEHDFSMKNTSVASLAPGESTLIQLQAPLGHMAGLWRLVEAGYWMDGSYYRMTLPEQPAVAVDRPVVYAPFVGRGR